MCKIVALSEADLVDNWRRILTMSSGLMAARVQMELRQPAMAVCLTESWWDFES